MEGSNYEDLRASLTFDEPLFGHGASIDNLCQTYLGDLDSYCPGLELHYPGEETYNTGLLEQIEAFSKMDVSDWRGEVSTVIRGLFHSSSVGFFLEKSLSLSPAPLKGFLKGMPPGPSSIRLFLSISKGSLKTYTKRCDSHTTHQKMEKGRCFGPSWTDATLL